MKCIAPSIRPAAWLKFTRHSSRPQAPSKKPGRPGMGVGEVLSKWRTSRFLVFRAGRNWRLANQKTGLRSKNTKTIHHPLWMIKSWRLVICYPEAGSQNGNPGLKKEDLKDMERQWKLYS